VADATANPAAQIMSLLLRRCFGRQAVFASVFHPHGPQPVVREVTWERTGDTLACRVHSRRGADVWRIDLTP
jgi:hypothetical protein